MRSDPSSFEWRRTFIRTFVERDLPQLGIQISSATISRFWSMSTHCHGRNWNASELARALGVTNKTVQHYLDVLTSSLVVQPLRPWHANVGKRHLERHPEIGASWEGFMFGQVIRRLGADPDECHFRATHSGPELDFLWVRGRKRWGFEFKRTSAPSLTWSLMTSIETLDLQKAFVIHAGRDTFPLHKQVLAVAANDLLAHVPEP